MRGARAMAALGMVALCGVAVWGVPALLLTTTGETVEGTLSGITPVIRLVAPDEVMFIGPAILFDVPVASIRQITIDFPRLVIDAGETVLIGPYSAFQGIAQTLKVERRAGSVSVPTAGVRAIALGGRGLQPVPRTWLGDGYLSMPEITTPRTIPATPAQPTETPAYDETVWNILTPTEIPAETTGTPWWVGLLIVAGLIAVVYFLAGARGT